MENEHKPPTTQAEALRMIEPLDPALPKGAFTAEEMDIAFFRLQEFIHALLPE
jgi:hypothetical protein